MEYIKKRIIFLNNELNRIKNINMKTMSYRIDSNFKYLTDKHYREYNEELEFLNNKLKIERGV